MTGTLVCKQIKLSYVQGKRALAAIDWPSIFDDLADFGTQCSQWRWCDLDRLTHVVLATDQETRMCAGILGLTERVSGRDRSLMVETAVVRPSQMAALPGAMLALVLAKVTSLGAKPAAIAGARFTRDALCVVGRGVRASEIYPPAHGNIVALETAKLARALGSGLSVLDLRGTTKPSLSRDLHELYGIRVPRLAPASSRKSDAKSVAIPKAARTGGSTRRPRKATRTGRTA